MGTNRVTVALEISSDESSDDGIAGGELGGRDSGVTSRDVELDVGGVNLPVEPVVVDILVQ